MPIILRQAVPAQLANSAIRSSTAASAHESEHLRIPGEPERAPTRQRARGGLPASATERQEQSEQGQYKRDFVGAKYRCPVCPFSIRHGRIYAKEPIAARRNTKHCLFRCVKSAGRLRLLRWASASSEPRLAALSRVLEGSGARSTDAHLSYRPTVTRSGLPFRSKSPKAITCVAPTNQEVVLPVVVEIGERDRGPGVVTGPWAIAPGGLKEWGVGRHGDAGLDVREAGCAGANVPSPLLSKTFNAPRPAPAARD